MIRSTPVGTAPSTSVLSGLRVSIFASGGKILSNVHLNPKANLAFKLQFFDFIQLSKFTKHL